MHPFPCHGSRARTRIGLSCSAGSAVRVRYPPARDMARTIVSVTVMRAQLCCESQSRRRETPGAPRDPCRSVATPLTHPHDAWSMPSERIQRQIDRSLDDAEAALHLDAATALFQRYAARLYLEQCSSTARC